MDIYLQIADSIQTKINTIWPSWYGIDLLEQIFDIIETELTADEPLDKVDATDKKPCMHCQHEKEYYKAHSFCGFCGRVFDR